jgi:hypothetical protein
VLLTITTMRAPATDVESETSAELPPHRRAHLQLVNGSLRRLLDLHLELVEEVDRGAG